MYSLQSFVIVLLVLAETNLCLQQYENDENIPEFDGKSTVYNVSSTLQNFPTSSEISKSEETSSQFGNFLETSTISDNQSNNYYPEFPIIKPSINEASINNLIYQEVENLTNKSFYNEYVQPHVSKAVLSGSEFIINETLDDAPNANLESLNSKKLVTDNSLEVANSISKNSANLLKTDSSLKNAANSASELSSAKSNSASTGTYLGSIITYVSNFLSGSSSSSKLSNTASNMASANAAKLAEDAAAKVATPKLSVPAAQQFTEELDLLPKTFKPKVTLAPTSMLKASSFPKLSVEKPTLATVSILKPTASLNEPKLITVTSVKPDLSVHTLMSNSQKTLAFSTLNAKSLLSVDSIVTEKLNSVSLSMSTNIIPTNAFSTIGYDTISMNALSNGIFSTYETNSFFATVYDNEQQFSDKLSETKISNDAVQTQAIASSESPKIPTNNAQDQPKLASEQPKPTSKEPKPTSEQPKPASEQPKPTSEQSKPASDQPKSSNSDSGLVNIGGQEVKLSPGEEQAYNLVQSINNVAGGKSAAAINVAGMELTIPPDAVGKFLQYGGIGLAAFNILSAHTITEKDTTIVSTYMIPTTVTFSTSITAAPSDNYGYAANNRYNGYYDPSAEAASIAAAAVASANSVASASKVAAEAMASNAAAAASQYYASVQAAASASANAEAEREKQLAEQSSSSNAAAASIYSKVQAEYSMSLASIEESMAAARNAKSQQMQQSNNNLPVDTQQIIPNARQQTPSYITVSPQQIPQNTEAASLQNQIYQQESPMQVQQSNAAQILPQQQSIRYVQQPAAQSNSVVYIYTQVNTIGANRQQQEVQPQSQIQQLQQPQQQTQQLQQQQPQQLQQQQTQQLHQQSQQPQYQQTQSIQQQQPQYQQTQSIQQQQPQYQQTQSIQQQQTQSIQQQQPQQPQQPQQQQQPQYLESTSVFQYPAQTQQYVPQVQQQQTGVYGYAIPNNVANYDSMHAQNVAPTYSQVYYAQPSNSQQLQQVANTPYATNVVNGYVSNPQLYSSIDYNMNGLDAKQTQYLQNVAYGTLATKVVY